MFPRTRSATERSVAVAIYHLSIKIISRGKSQSAVAAAAYRAGELIKNERDGVTHDYTRKRGIIHTEILLPDNAPSECRDRAVLWNAVEKTERAHNAQLAREIEVALPKELTAIQHRILVRDYVKQNFVAAGMCADICIHDKGDGNPHAHIMLTLRPFEPSGAWGAKSKKEYILDANGERIRLPSGEYKSRKIPATDWNEQTKAEEWRAAWAETANLYLEKLNHPARLDHRSYERQDIEQAPTVHLGVAAFQMERRGIRTDRGNINRDIEVTNSEIRQLRARIAKLRDWLTDEAKNAEPSIQDVFTSILRGGGSKAYWRRNADLKTASQILIFIQSNGIHDMESLRKTVGDMYGRQGAIGGRLNRMDRRMKTLDKHIEQCGILKEYSGHMANYRKLYSQYEKLRDSTGLGAKRKAQKALDTANAYHEAHRMEITLYEAAERYIKDTLNGRTAIPLDAWKAERAKLTAERKTLAQDYFKLKEEVRQAEIIRRNIEDVMREESRERQPQQRAQGLEI